MFGDILSLFECSTVVGLEQDGRVMLNPPMHSVLKPDTRVIHLAEDDGALKPRIDPPIPDLSAGSLRKWRRTGE
jgi:hypothetical protein